MFDDARSLSPAASIDVDLCIVGAGPVGLAVASHFVGTGVRVCPILESGGVKTSVDGQDLMGGEAIGQPYLPLHWTRQARFGGTTGWWGQCRPFDALEDLAPRPWLGHPGWPIALADLATFEEAACAFCGLGDGKFDLGG